MWYRDLDGTTAEKIETIAAFFDCSDETAAEVLTECELRNAIGNRGEPYSVVFADLTDYELLSHIEASILGRFADVDKRDLAQLFHDAWIEGIQRKDRVTVKLSTDTDGCCLNCHTSVAWWEQICDYCNSKEIDRQVMVTVKGSFAELWADNDQTIDGSTWEGDVADFAYTILSDRPGLVSELRAEGYKLDLSEYDGEIADVEDDAAQ